MWESVASKKNAWHHCCRRPTYVGLQVILLIPYLNGVIKRISGRTGASLWFRRYTCGFSVAQLRNDNASCHRHATTVRGPAPEAGRHIIGRCHVALHGQPSSSFDCQKVKKGKAWILDIVWQICYKCYRWLTRTAALHNPGSGSWLAWADDTVARYAAIHCPR